MNQIRFTKEGYEAFKKELEELRTERPGVIEDVQKARDLGDLKENGYYQASKAKLRQIDSRMTYLNFHLKTGIVVDDKKGNGIGIGSVVTLANGSKEVTYHIVGDFEANPSEGKLSLRSPIGSALEGHKTGEKVTIKIPSGDVTYLIKKVS